MRDLEKYRGVIPAFYACYDEDGEISAERTEALALHFLKKGVKGLYVNGSSGECIYQSVEDRKKVLEHVMKAVGGKLTIIAHVACNNTKDSVELAAHAEKLGVDAIAAIPPIYFHLPDHAIADYWTAAGRCGFKSLPFQKNAGKSQCHRCEKLLHAGAGYPDFQGSWRRGQHCL